ncbi:Pantothenate transporter FEN2 [Colletotrichum siamense]|uniref:Pantothenate transporter FEN2 n=1 Tax=Colletotrichum siamense TaxID=690259 RepID=A0A9P5ESN8_COLSI|nr:Pantothenate transporter FEN2 [Colletotrichum siamense]KAF4858759.1 Pantothenate transporter FEN2 [Colletotrichum siamense]
MPGHSFRTAVGRLVALGTVLTFLTFQYIASQTRTSFGFYEAFFQFSSCIIVFNFLLIITRWTEYEPIPGIKDNHRLPTINVIIPAYNESEFVRNSISSVASSDYPKEKIHIIIVDDGSSDDTWSHIQYAAQEALRSEPLLRCTTIQHEINRGKRQAMATAFTTATNEVIVTLDSDTILEKQALRNLVSPLVLDSDIGGVAGHLSVFNVHSEGWKSFIPRTLDCLFEQNGNIPRAAQSKYGFVTILPGAISAVRREASQPHAQDLVDAKFLGKPLRHGEDVQLTMNLLSDGWRLRYQSNAVVYTVAPETLRKAFLMYVRWERSNYTYWILGLVKLAFTDAKRLVLNRLGLLSLSQSGASLDLEKQHGKRVANARQPDFAPMLTIICATCATLSCVEAAFCWVWGAFRSPWVTTMNIPGTVAFTFDDGPSFYTDYILHEFAQFNATATFFLDTSSWLTEENHSGYWESLVRRTVEDGHLIGLTTKSCDGGSPNYDETKHALAEARERIGRIFVSSTSSSGRHPMYVRAPPECTMQNGCVEKLTLDGQRLVFPGINSEDPHDDPGRDLNSTSFLSDLESADPEKSSFLIRMHDTEQTALTVGGLVQSFVHKGFKPITVGDCIVKMGVSDNLNIQVAANDVGAGDAIAIGQSSGSDGGITPVESEPKGYIDPKEERAFVWRLDLFFLTIGFLGYMFKYIDQTNISNAYVSGMKEDLSLFGNELNYFTTFFNIGYMIMLYPSCIIISHFGPSKWLPACELIWGVLTCCLSVVTSSKQVYGLRFLIGLFEGTAWPGYFTLISQWYMPHEVALRMSLYNIAQPAGAMLSGAMQGALSTNFEGVAGRSGWRWAFIINGACTIVVALAAFFILPGYPERPNPLSKFYMTDRHIEIAVARGRRIGRKPQIGITVKSFLRCFTFWQLWAIAIAWPVGGNFTPASYFNLWLKSLKNSDGTVKYSVAMLNYLPIAGQGLQLISELLFSGFSGYFGVHLPFLLLHSAINIASQVILIVRPKNEGAYMAGWYMNYIGAVSTMLLCSWGSAHLQHEPEVRTVLFASGTVLAYIMSAFIPIAAFPASEAPNWRIGSKLYLAFALVAVVIFIGIHFGFKWEEKKQQKEAVKEDLAGEPDDANTGVKTVSLETEK